MIKTNRPKKHSLTLKGHRTAETRFGANTRRGVAPGPSHTLSSEESPRALRQKVPAVKARSLWPRVHEEGFWPEFARAMGPAVGYSDACRGSLGSL